MAILYRFPKGFVTAHATLGWREMLFGLERGFLDEATVQELATDKVVLESGPESPEMRLALLTPGDLSEARNILAAAAGTGNADLDSECARKWCFLVLQWLFEHQEQSADPLSEVEGVYADFGYLTEVAPFVRYEPLSPRGNEPSDPKARLVTRWAKYLADRQEEFGPGRKL
jgi:hypothetical protein